MSTVTIVCGMLLILIGGVGYIYGLMNDKASLTALIPAVFGLVLAALGVISLSRENLRKHLMHAAAAISLLGFILTAGRLVMKVSELTMSPAVVSQGSMALVCLAFVLLAIRSFSAARKS